MEAPLWRLLQLVDLMLPAYIANMLPPLVRYWPGWNRPIATRYLGTHKTVVGFAAGVSAALVTAFLQAGLAWPRALVAHEHRLAVGLLLGVGAMGGDAVKSFFKRLVGIPPGRPWIPFDQIDFAVGALVLTARYDFLSAVDVAIVLVATAIGHVSVNHVAYWLGLRDAKW